MRHPLSHHAARSQNERDWRPPSVLGSLLLVPLSLTLLWALDHPELATAAIVGAAVARAAPTVSTRLTDE